MNPSIVYTTLAMLAVLTTSSLVVFTAAVLAPEAAPDLGLDPKLIGPFTSVIYLIAAFVGAITGGLIARFGAIRVCQSTMMSAAAAMLLLAAGHPLAALISACLLGYCYGPFNPASAHILSGLSSPRWQPFVFSLKQTGVPLGGALAGGVVPLLVLAFGWRGAALSMGAVGLVVTVFLQPLRRRFDRGTRPVSVTAFVNVWAPLRLVMIDPLLRRYTFAAFAYAGCQVSSGVYMVVFLTESHGLALASAGLVLACMQLGGFAGRLIWGALSGRYLSSRVMLVLLGMMAAVCLVLTASMSGAWPKSALFAVATLLGTSTFGWNGIMLSEIATHSPKGMAAEATAGMQLVMFGGVVVFPMGFGLVAASAGYSAAFGALAVLAVGGVTLLSRISREATGDA
jgi:MFS family permease